MTGYRKNFKKKLDSCKGTITDYSISNEPIIPNYYVGQKDCFLHTITIKKDDGSEVKFGLCQVTDEQRFDKGTYVTFNHVKKSEVKDMNTIVSKTFAKTYTPEEIAQINANNQVSTASIESESNTKEVKKRSSRNTLR